MSLQLHSLDLWVIGIYFAFALFLGLWLSRRRAGNDEEDFFVAGRKLGWPVIGASLFASNISSEHLIGLSADGFRTGLAVGNYEWGATIVLIILASVFIPFYVGSRIRTMPEFLDRRFGPGARVYLSIMTITANVLVRISVALYAGALVMEQMFGMEFWSSILILSVVTVAYTAVGGLRAVMYTDALQTVVLLAGTIAMTWFALDQVGGWRVLQSTLDQDMFTMVRPAADPEIPWTGLLIGVPILGVWYWCTDQVIVQRVLSAKNIHEARMGAMFAAVLKIFPVFLFVLPGLCARVLYPEIEAQVVFPMMVTELLPIGVTGLVAAALIAALMSSIDSTLNSTGTLVSLDFYQRYRPHATPAQIVRVGRWTTIVVMIFGILWVNVVANASSLFQYLQEVNAAISPPIAAAFLIGVFWKRANYQGVMTALLGGLALGLTFTWLKLFPFLISAGINFAFSVLLLVIVSYLTPPPRPEQVEGLTFASIKSVMHGQVTVRQKWVFRALVGTLLVTMAGLWTYFS
jgi:solute:Na+ symporter, SSS family